MLIQLDKYASFTREKWINKALNLLSSCSILSLITQQLSILPLKMFKLLIDLV